MTTHAFPSEPTDSFPPVESVVVESKTPRAEAEEVEGESARKKKMKMTTAAGKKIILRQTRKYKSALPKTPGVLVPKSVPAYALIKENTKKEMEVSSYDTDFDSKTLVDVDGNPLVKLVPYPLFGHHIQGFTNAVWKSELFFISGRLPPHQCIGYDCTNSVLKFNTESQQWSKCKSIPTPRFTHMAVVASDYIYVFGDYPIPHKLIAQHNWGQRFDIKADAWEDLPPPPPLLYTLYQPRAYAVYYKCKAFTYTTKDDKDESNAVSVSENEHLILFPLPKHGNHTPISVFSCTANKWLPNLFPDLPHDAPPIFPHKNAGTFKDRLAIIDGFLLWHRGGAIHGYDLLKQLYLPELYRGTGRDYSDSHFDPPMFLIHPGDHKLFLIFQLDDYIVHCYEFLVQLRQQGEAGRSLSLDLESYSSICTKSIKQTFLQDVLLL